MSAIIGNIWLCIDCTLLHANGEYSPDRPADLPEPLSAIGVGESVTLGLLAEEHHEDCTPEDREEGCSCETDTFSTSPCGGCGDWHHGERHAATVWQDSVTL